MPGSVIKQLETFADFYVEKNKVISKNIANTQTANYRREDIVFKDVLSESISATLKGSERKHFGAQVSEGGDSQNFERVLDNSTELNSGVNNVDIDKEMAELAENTLRFKFVSKKLGDYYKNLQEVIKGSR